MNTDQLRILRKTLGLNQEEFARLFDVHPMTVSKWERGESMPTAYQYGLMQKFQLAADKGKEEVAKELKGLLVTAGVIAALVFLLTKG